MFKRLFSLHYFIMSEAETPEQDTKEMIEKINKEQMKLIIKFTYTSINNYMEKKMENHDVIDLRHFSECIDSYSTCIRYLRMFHEAVDQLYEYHRKKTTQS